MLVARARDRCIDRLPSDMPQVHLHLQPLQARAAGPRAEMKPTRVYHWKVVSDFLKGMSVSTLARRYRRPRAWVESVLREAM